MFADLATDRLAEQKQVSQLRIAGPCVPPYQVLVHASEAFYYFPLSAAVMCKIILETIPSGCSKFI